MNNQFATLEMVSNGVIVRYMVAAKRLVNGSEVWLTDAVSIFCLQEDLAKTVEKAYLSAVNILEMIKNGEMIQVK